MAYVMAIFRKQMTTPITWSMILSSVDIVKKDILIKTVKELQNCPWIPNSQYHNQIRSELQTCCDAFNSLLVTQNNTQTGDIIKYEVDQKRKIQVNGNMYQMLPKTSPFPDKPFKKCAVVGNGGILINSCCGSEIDQADYVIRLNLPQMNNSYDIGTRTDLVTANPSILVERFSRLNERRKPFSDMMKVYGPALILMPAFSFAANTDLSFKAFYTLEDFGSGQKVVYFHPKYLKNLYIHWNNKGLKVRRLSSGLMLVSSALELCEKITLYGFWPFSQDLEGNPIPYHYYDNRLPNYVMHSMPDEFFFYAQMHSQGALQMRIGRCF
ncbi:alpha-2,8-sialyltransferase 8F-like [Discoglossus pictus]